MWKGHSVASHPSASGRDPSPVPFDPLHQGGWLGTLRAERGSIVVPVNLLKDHWVMEDMPARPRGLRRIDRW